MADNVNYSYQVPGNVPVILQKGLTCWAAAAAMMISWKKGRTLTIEEALTPLGVAPNDPKRTTYLALYKRGSGLLKDDLTQLAFAAQMKYFSAPRSFSPKQLADLMAARASPLMILIYYANTLGMTHFCVVKRIYTSYDTGMNMIEFNDPNDIASKDGFLDQLIEQMGAAADKFPYSQVFYW
jgi:hypothetical protein